MENVNNIPFADKTPEEIAKSILTGLNNGSVSMDDFIAMLSTVINANKATQNAGIPANVPPVPVGPVAQQPAPHQRFQSRHKESLMRDTLDDFIEKNRNLLVLPDMLANTNGILDYIHDEILDSYETTREMMNTNVQKGAKAVPAIDVLPANVVTDLLINTGEVKRLAGSANSTGTKLICKHYFKNESTNWQYKWSGQWQVIEDDENSPLATIYRRIAPMSANSLKTTMKSLRNSADLVYMRTDHTLTFWRNGIYDMANQRFMAYDDPNYEATYGKFITLRKCHTNHPLGAPWGNDPVCKIDLTTGKAVEPVIIQPDGKPWSAMQGLTAPFRLGTPIGDASLKVILQAAQFMFRGRGGEPGMFHFWINYNCAGGNGKNFLAELFARIVQRNPEELHEGDEDLMRSDAIGHKSVEELGERFMLNDKALVWMMNYSGETNTAKQGSQIEDVSILKRLGRKEHITIENKFKDALEICLEYVWFIQMANNMPRISEKNGSVKNAIVAVPFEVVLGRTRPWIKDKYIRQEDVASYYAWYITCECPMWDTYDQDALNTLAPFKDAMLENSMVTLRFFKDLCTTTEMDIIPMEYAYSLYPGWAEENGVNYQPEFNQFCVDAKQFGMDNKHGVYFTDKRVRITPKDIEEYTDINDKNFIESLKRWGKSHKHKSRGEYSQFQMVEENSAYSTGVRNEWLGKLARDVAGKQYNRGALVRNVSWRKQSIVPETDQEELIYDDGMQTA